MLYKKSFVVVVIEKTDYFIYGTVTELSERSRHLSSSVRLLNEQTSSHQKKSVNDPLVKHQLKKPNDASYLYKLCRKQEI